MRDPRHDLTAQELIYAATALRAEAQRNSSSRPTAQTSKPRTSSMVINKRRGEADRRSEIPLTNFRGIELRDFPAEIARLALVITEYQCDVLYRGQKLALAEFLPLRNENWITCGNALRIDWLSVCPPTGTGVKFQADDLFTKPLDQAEIDFENEGGRRTSAGIHPIWVSRGK